MNTRSNNSRRPAPSSRHEARLIPVKEICEICCLALCRIVVPKLARDWR